MSWQCSRMILKTGKVQMYSSDVSRSEGSIVTSFPVNASLKCPSNYVFMNGRELGITYRCPVHVLREQIIIGFQLEMRQNRTRGEVINSHESKMKKKTAQIKRK